MEKVNAIIESLLTDPLSHVQTDSYRGCIENTIPRVLRQFNPIALQYKVNDATGKEVVVKVNVYVGSVKKDGAILDNGQGVFFATPSVIRGGKDDSEAPKASPMFPNEARLRDFTYETEISANVHIQVESEATEFNTIISYDDPKKRIRIGRLPIMVRSHLCTLNTITDDPKVSGECTQDQGGYYIIDGSEKVVVGQERQVENRPYTRKYNDTENLIVSCECRSVPEEKFQPPRTTSVRLHRSDHTIRVIAPGMKNAVPWILLMRSLGVATEAQMCDLVAIHLNSSLHDSLLDFLRPSLTEYDEYRSLTMQDALLQTWSLVSGTKLEEDTPLNAFRLRDVNRILKENILPHVGYESSPKALLIGSMIADMFLVYKKLTKPTDKDSYVNKRIDMGGYLLGKLFRDLYFRVQKKVQEKMNIHVNASEFPREAIRIIPEAFLQKEMVDSSILDEGFRYAFKSCWGMKNAPCVVGVAQELSRYSYPSYLSHVRRINTPLPDTAKMREPHALHASTWGFACPIETPDGRNTGVRKNFAVAARITVGLASHPIEALCKKLQDDFVPLSVVIPSIHSPAIQQIGTPVYLNERLIGYVWEASRFVKTFRSLRRGGIIHPYVSIRHSISITKSYIIISCDDGRPIRPLLVVDEEKKIGTYPTEKKTVAHLCTGRDDISDKDFFSIERIIDLEGLRAWKEDQSSLKQGILEYVDAQEQEDCLIAMSDEDRLLKDHVERRFTHQEIHPSLIMGVLGLNIPFTQTNQAPRNVYSTAQGKQAVGIYATNFNNRMDNKVMILQYPQKPIVTTHYAPYIRNEIMPHGINAVVAIMSYSGYNQEDAVIINRGAVERGLFNSATFRALGIKEDIKEQETIGLVPETDIVNPKKARRDLLDSRGIVKVGSLIDEDDVLVMKTSPSNFRDATRKQQLLSDSSLQTKRHESGIVDSVFVDEERQDGTLVKIRLRKPKRPELGDKFSSRHGQKGTIGMVLPEADMPTNADGIKPDILVNPHAIPSRMTIGQLVEVILGKRGALRGEQYAATAFENGDPRTVCKLLEESGMEGYANEVLYNGRTGEQLRVNIFMGPTFYQRLMHQVADKVNVRTTGPRSALTKQPVGGRGAGGGLRIGEMERDALISHGVSTFLKESLMERSDKSHIWIGTRTGLISACNPEQNKYHDFLTEDFSRVRARDKEGRLQQGDDRIVLSNPRSEFCRIEVPHALKLLIQELEAQGMHMSMISEVVMKAWQTVDEETRIAYNELSRHLTKRGEQLEGVKDVSWVKPAVQWAVHRYRSCNLSIGPLFLPMIQSIQRELGFLQDKVETQRLDELGSNQSVIVVSSHSAIESLIKPTVGDVESLLLVNEKKKLTSKQVSHIQQCGFVRAPSFILKLSSSWSVWQKMYRYPEKSLTELLKGTGLITSRIEPLYPTIHSSEHVAGSPLDLFHRMQMFGLTKSPVKSDGLEGIQRGFVVGHNACPIPFSHENRTATLYSLMDQERSLLMSEAKKIFRNSISIFQQFQRVSMTEMVDETRNLYRWCFPMSRIEKKEYDGIAKLFDFVQDSSDSDDTKYSLLCMPEGVIAPSSEGTFGATRTFKVDSSPASNRTVILPPYQNVLNRYTPVKPAYEMADTSFMSPIKYLGRFPAHLIDHESQLYPHVRMEWTEFCPCVKLKGDNVIAPDYSVGSRGTAESEQTTMAMAMTRLVCEPEFLWEGLHGSVGVLYWSPYVGWAHSLGLNEVVWNPDTKQMTGDLDSAHMIVLRWNTQIHWEELSQWIRDHKPAIDAMRDRVHEWLAANGSKAVERYMKEMVKIPSRDSLETVDSAKTKRDLNLSVPIHKGDAVGTLLGAGGVVAKRNRLLTQLSLEIKDDKELIIKGTIDPSFQDKDLRSLFVGYLSYTTETIEADVLHTIVSTREPSYVIKEIRRKEIKAEINPIMIGNGVQRTYRSQSSSFILRGQKEDIDFYKNAMHIETEPVEDDVATTMVALAGKKNFIIIVPDMSFMFESSDMVESRVESLQTQLESLKEKYGFTCSFNIIYLSHNFMPTYDYPVKQSNVIQILDDDEHVVKWNVAAMESFISMVQNQSELRNLLGNPSYVMWMPPYWTAKTPTQSLMQLFMEPEYKDGKLFLFKSDKEAPWLYSFEGGKIDSQTSKILEDESEWSNTLDRMWSEDDWKNFLEESMHDSGTSIIESEASLVYISQILKNEDTWNIQLTQRVELLESHSITIKAEDKSKSWNYLLTNYFTIKEEEIAVEEKSDSITLEWKRPNDSVSVVISILQQLQKALDIIWIMERIEETDDGIIIDMRKAKEDEKMIQIYEDSEDNILNLSNGITIPFHIVFALEDELRNHFVSIERMDSHHLSAKDIDGNEGIIVLQPEFALIDSDSPEIKQILSTITTQYGSVVVYAALTNMTDEDENDISEGSGDLQKAQLRTDLDQPSTAQRIAMEDI